MVDDQVDAAYPTGGRGPNARTSAFTLTLRIRENSLREADLLHFVRAAIITLVSVLPSSFHPQKGIWEPVTRPACETRRMNGCADEV